MQFFMKYDCYYHPLTVLLLILSGCRKQLNSFKRRIFFKHIKKSVILSVPLVAWLHKIKEALDKSHPTLLLAI